MLDWEDLRRFFPVTQKYIYLNHAGVSPLSTQVQSSMEAFLKEATENGYTNPEMWTETIESCRQSAARLINANPDEIAFVKNTTQGIILTANGINWQVGDNVVTTNVEFPSNIYPWWNLERHGVETRLVQEMNKRILVEDIIAKIDSRTRIVTISHVEFASGYRNDITTIGEICRDKGILFFVDAIQALGAFEVDVKKQHIDFLSADGHKWLLGPEGAAIYYCAKNKLNQLTNTNIGWASVVDDLSFSEYNLTQKPSARRFEEGSYNTVGIFGLNAAITLLLEIGIPNIERRILDLTQCLIKNLYDQGYEILSPVENELERSGIVIFRSRKFSSDMLFEIFYQSGVSCAKRGGGIRLSPHFYNSEAEIDIVADILSTVAD
ncbi:aminotransferase [Candidatus Poribacteria bacterium]|nr:aminotransferase [Candidatus Poribacteria bacterium]